MITHLVVMSNGLKSVHKSVDLDSTLCARRVFPASMYGLLKWMYSERVDVMAKAAAAKSTS